jgi:hypothetical protein
VSSVVKFVVAIRARLYRKFALFLVGKDVQILPVSALLIIGVGDQVVS